MASLEEWWAAWWEDDWSWEGLSKKTWEGWITLEDNSTSSPDPLYLKDGPSILERFGDRARTANLQDYWRNHFDQLLDWETPEGRVIKFSPFHYPARNPDGTYPEDRNRPDLTFLRDQIAAILNGHTHDPINVDQFPSFDIRAQFQGCVFRAFPDRSMIKNRHRKFIALSADNAAFLNEFDFRTTKFSRNTSFRRSYFQERFLVESAEFAGSTYFVETTFSEAAQFDDVLLGETCRFDRAAFQRQALFNRSGFGGEANFSETQFLDAVTLDGTLFTGPATFDSAAFARPSSFGDTCFCNRAVFSGKGAGTEASSAKSSIILHDYVDAGLAGTMTTPTTLTWIASRSFTSTNFRDAVFFGETWFDNRDLLAETSFDNVVFFKPVSFDGSHIHPGTHFNRTDFEAALQPSELFSHPSIEKQSLKAKLSKAYQLSRRVSQLDSASPPRYLEWRKKFEKNALRLWLRDDDFNYFDRLEDCYRTLKMHMEVKRDRGQEARFFKLELKARRKRKDSHVPYWERLASDIYGGLSDYGTLIFRPLVLLFGSVLVFAFIYFMVGTPHGPDWVSDALHTLQFSFGRALPFGPWGDPPPNTMMSSLLLETAIDCNSDADCAEPTITAKAIAILVRLIGSAQSLLAIVLLFLVGLAARRKFQIN
jgi:hypothetical protein